MTQAALPVSDVSNSGWSPVPIYAQIDTPSPPDTTWVTASASGAIFVVQLQPLAPPVAGPQTLTIRARGVAPGVGQVTYFLLQGTALGADIVAARTVQPGPAFDAYDLTLTEQEVDLIVDYTNLRVMVVVGGFGSGSLGSPSGSLSGSGPPGTCVGDCGYRGAITLTVSGCNCPGGGIDGSFTLTYQGINADGMLTWQSGSIANPCGQSLPMGYLLWYNPNTGCYIQGYHGTCGPGDGVDQGTGTPGYVYSCTPLHIQWVWFSGSCPGCGYPITVVATE